MRVALYCRVSTDEQDVLKQETDLLSYCERLKYDVYRVYKDVYSGAYASRPAFNELIKDMRAGKFDAIIVTKLDRLARSLSHLLALLNEFDHKRVHFISTTQNFDTTSPQGRLILHIVGAFAEFERELIRERTREGLKHAVNVGKRGKDKKKRKKKGGSKTRLFYEETGAAFLL